jgi:hypothetical protein
VEDRPVRPGSRQTLRFNPSNATTGTVERVVADDGSRRVHKSLRRPGATASDATYWITSSTDPAHWSYWRREAEVYSDVRFRSSLTGTGLDLPVAEVEEGSGSVSLWLEDVAGLAGTDFVLEDHVAAATALGRWQGGPVGTVPGWSSQRFLRDYSTSRPVDLNLVDDDHAWDQPLIRAAWPGDLRAGWERLLAHREHLLTVMEQLPRTLCHLDAWVSNAIRRPSGDVVLLDWAFAGDGAVGEDLGNYLPDAVFDLFWPAERLAELEALCFPAYVTGLREAGWSGDQEQARLGVVASCVKYAWLLPLMLQQAGRTEHTAYHRGADAERLYSQRGLALAHLVAWCDEALTRSR